MKIAIVGGSGFVGQHLISSMLESHPDWSLRALGRSFNGEVKGKLEKVRCDLFSMLEIEEGLEGMDVAIYLVHSMLPSSKLAQGDFADYDLILADNFSRAAKKKNIKKIIYLSGIIPPESLRNNTLSRHLSSRLEVEHCLRASGIDTVCLRAGIVLGEDGSSFQMIYRLVKRLRVMICPAWTSTKSSPVDISDVVASITHSVTSVTQGTFDLAGGSIVSYLEMMKILAQELKRKCFFIDIPLFTPALSKLWVCLVTGAPKNLVYPLISSLTQQMLPEKKQTLEIPGRKNLTYRESIRNSLKVLLQKNLEPTAYKARNQRTSENIVQSVQRFHLPLGKNAVSISRLYAQWLNDHHFIFIKTVVDKDNVTFKIPIINLTILQLTYSHERSSSDRALFYITDGVLAKKRKKGRLEFRETIDRKNILAAIHDFAPALPWYVYKYTQAIFHLFVMNRFGMYLEKLDKSKFNSD